MLSLSVCFLICSGAVHTTGTSKEAVGCEGAGLPQKHVAWSVYTGGVQYGIICHVDWSLHLCKWGRVLTNAACENRNGTKHGGVLERLRQEDYVFEVSLGFMERTCLENRGKGRI